MGRSTAWIRFIADGSQLERIDPAAAMTAVTEALRPTGVTLRQILPPSAGSIDVILESDDSAAVAEVVPLVRSALRLGSGGYQRLQPPEAVRFVGGVGAVCKCGGVDGDHFPDCEHFRHKA
jgi:hypothetical protein